MDDTVGLFMDEDGDIGDLSFELPADFKHTSLTFPSSKELDEQFKMIKELDALYDALNKSNNEIDSMRYIRQIIILSNNIEIIQNA